MSEWGSRTTQGSSLTITGLVMMCPVPPSPHNTISIAGSHHDYLHTTLLVIASLPLTNFFNWNLLRGLRAAVFFIFSIFNYFAPQTETEKLNQTLQIMKFSLSDISNKTPRMARLVTSGIARQVLALLPQN